MGGVAGHRGLWGFVRGGMGAVSKPCGGGARGRRSNPRQCRRLQVLVRAGRAYGVAMEDGEEIEARAIASNLDPKVTFLKLIEPRDLPPEFVAAIKNFRSEGTSCKINLALGGLPQFTAYPRLPVRSIAPPCTSVQASNTWNAPGTTPNMAARPTGRCSNSPSHHVRPNAGARGQDIMGIFLQYAPYTLRGKHVG